MARAHPLATDPTTSDSPSVPHLTLHTHVCVFGYIISILIRFSVQHQMVGCIKRGGGTHHLNKVEKSDFLLRGETTIFLIASNMASKSVRLRK